MKHVDLVAFEHNLVYNRGCPDKDGPFYSVDSCIRDIQYPAGPVRSPRRSWCDEKWKTFQQGSRVNATLVQFRHEHGIVLLASAP